MFGGCAHVHEAAPPNFTVFRPPALYRFSGHFSNMYMSIKLSYHYSAADLPQNSEISGSVVVRFRTADALDFASLRRPASKLRDASNRCLIIDPWSDPQSVVGSLIGGGITDPPNHQFLVGSIRGPILDRWTNHRFLVASSI